MTGAIFKEWVMETISLERTELKFDYGLFRPSCTARALHRWKPVTAEAILNWKGTEAEGMEFHPYGDKAETGLLWRPNDPVTAEQLVALDGLLENLGGDTLENYLRVRHATTTLKIPLGHLTPMAVCSTMLHVFIGTDSSQLEEDAAEQLLGLYRPEAWEPTLGAVRRSFHRFCNTPWWKVEHLSIGAQKALVVVPRAWCWKSGQGRKTERQLPAKPTDTKTTQKLGTIEAVYLREGNLVRRTLSVDEVLDWDDETRSGAEFRPAGDCRALSVLFKGSVTLFELKRVVDLLEGAGGETQDMILRIHFWVNVLAEGWQRLTVDWLKRAEVGVFYGASFFELHSAATYELIEKPLARWNRTLAHSEVTKGLQDSEIQPTLKFMYDKVDLGDTKALLAMPCG
jgi:hypothetical protein